LGYNNLERILEHLVHLELTLEHQDNLERTLVLDILDNLDNLDTPDNLDTLVLILEVDTLDNNQVILLERKMTKKSKMTSKRKMTRTRTPKKNKKKPSRNTLNNRKKWHGKLSSIKLTKIEAAPLTNENSVISGPFLVHKDLD